jgi:predicted methyltransferase
MLIDRRLWLTGAGASLLAGCGEKKVAPKGKASTAKAPPATLEKVLAGEWRSDADRARDVYRHPAQSLAFWGLKPATTVVEFWPGAGWYSDILAPFLDESGGRFYAAVQEASDGDAATIQMVAAYKRRLESRKRLYGDVQFTTFGPTSGPVAPAGSADLVLFLRNIHNWMAGGIVEKAFADAFAALRPGGVLGIEEHRANPGGVQDVLAANGYVQEAYVKQLAAEAGFSFDKASEINANIEDTKDHPFGVWTLPPVRRTSPRGQPADPAFDRAPFDAIGESDRMTLRFVKPA